MSTIIIIFLSVFSRTKSGRLHLFSNSIGNSKHFLPLFLDNTYFVTFHVITLG